MDWSEKRIEPRFNIAPSQEIITIVQLPLEQPSLQTAVWGLQPFWLQAGRPPPINARAESLSSSAMFREAQRCLIPATGFYEWRTGQPMHIRLRSGAGVRVRGPVAAAGSPRRATDGGDRHDEAERADGHDPHAHAGHPAARGRTPLAGPERRRARDRQRGRWQPVEMEAYAVSRQVNAWANEGPELIAPAGEGAAPEAEVQLGLPLSS